MVPELNREEIDGLPPNVRDLYCDRRSWNGPVEQAQRKVDKAQHELTLALRAREHLAVELRKACTHPNRFQYVDHGQLIKCRCCGGEVFGLGFGTGEIINDH